MKIVGTNRNSDCLFHKYTIFAIEGIYLTNNNNKTNKKTKQKRERQKEKRKATEQDSNPAPCQKLYEHKVNVLTTTDKKLFLSVFTVIC